MRVVHVNTSETQGGAARAASRIHKALLQTGIDSHMLVQSKETDDCTVMGPGTSMQKAAAIIRPFLDKLPKLFYKNGPKAHFSAAWVPMSGIANRINALKPDIVHLHWIGEGMMSIEEIARIKSPIIWTLHDSWAFTGGCHVRLSCERYLDGCGSCPVLGSRRQRDLSSIVFNRKKRTYSKIKNFSITAPSKWLAESAAASKLLGERKVVPIPIPLDTRSFSPVAKSVARNILNLPEKKQFILFGAKNALGDQNKGFTLLLDSLNRIQTEDVELLIIGSNKPAIPFETGIETHYLGTIHDNIALQIIYSAADVTVVPSYQEAFGQAATESMSCGTPVVAFGTTGLLDIVDHKANGYLAEPYSTADLAKGIDWVLSNKNNETTSRAAREKAVSAFDVSVVIQAYLDQYKKALGIGS